MDTNPGIYSLVVFASLVTVIVSGIAFGLTTWLTYEILDVIRDKLSGRLK